MKLVLGLLVSVSMFACSRDKTKPESAPADVAAITPSYESDGSNAEVNPGEEPTASSADEVIAEADVATGDEVSSDPAVSALLGDWIKKCVSINFGSNDIAAPLGYQLLLTFDDKNTLTVKQTFFTDDKCATPYSQAVADTNLARFEGVTGEPATSDVIKYFTDLVNGYITSTRYVASLPNSGEIGTIDLTTNDITDYSSYQIVADTLFLAETCFQESDPLLQTCKVIGETADDRSERFVDQAGYRRVK